MGWSRGHRFAPWLSIALPCDWDCPVDALADLLGGPQAHRLLATVAAKAGLPPKSSRRSWASSFTTLEKSTRTAALVSDESLAFASVKRDDPHSPCKSNKKFRIWYQHCKKIICKVGAFTFCEACVWGVTLTAPCISLPQSSGRGVFGALHSRPVPQTTN